MCIASNASASRRAAQRLDLQRNFVGRQGPGARTISPPAMAAAAAIKGAIATSEA